MGIDPAMLNDAQKALIPIKDRKRLGMGPTHSEARKAAMIEHEKDLQREIRAYLGHNGVRRIINPPMNKKSHLPEGHPDFTFCYKGVAVVWEAKVQKNVLQPDQVKAREELIADGWQHREVRSIFDCQQHLREIDAAVEGRVG